MSPKKREQLWVSIWVRRVEPEKITRNNLGLYGFNLGSMGSVWVLRALWVLRVLRVLWVQFGGSMGFGCWVYGSGLGFRLLWVQFGFYGFRV